LTDGSGGRRDALLGKYGTEESRLEYARVIAEWEAAGRRLFICTPAIFHAVIGFLTREKQVVQSQRPVVILYGRRLAQNCEKISAEFATTHRRT
jgi:hypothetical protein